jgi:hypothetical protein
MLDTMRGCGDRMSDHSEEGRCHLGSYPISSSSADFSATHGDPRLPNLKRRLPGKQKEKKTAQKASTLTLARRVL